MPNIRFTKAHSSHERQQTVTELQIWLDTQQNLSPFKRRLIQAALTYGKQDSFIHINRLSNLFVDGAELHCMEQIFTCATQRGFAALPDHHLHQYIVEQLKELSDSSKLKANLMQIVISCGVIHGPLSASLQSQLRPLYQLATQDTLNKKIKDFQQSLDALQQQDTNVLLGSICTIGLGYCINLPLSVLALGCATLYGVYYVKEGRSPLAKESQVHLKTLLVIYKSLTQNGDSDTHNPMVLQILRVIAPYVTSEDLWHWRKGDGRQYTVSSGPHSDFLRIMSTPPHYWAYVRQREHESEYDMHERLDDKMQMLETRHNFWQKAYPEIIREAYGLETNHKP